MNFVRAVWIFVGAVVGLQVFLLLGQALPEDTSRWLSEEGVPLGSIEVPYVVFPWVLSATVGAVLAVFLWRWRFSRR